MSEMFMCRGKPVFFSNGMGETLFKTWSLVAGQKGYSKLAELLEDQSKAGLGCCATGMDMEYLADEYLKIDILAHWIDTMQTVHADIISAGSISKKMDVKWSDDHRTSISQRLQLLIDALKDNTENT